MNLKSLSSSYADFYIENDVLFLETAENSVQILLDQIEILRFIPADPEKGYGYLEIQKNDHGINRIFFDAEQEVEFLSAYHTIQKRITELRNTRVMETIPTKALAPSPIVDSQASTTDEADHLQETIVFSTDQIQEEESIPETYATTETDEPHSKKGWILGAVVFGLMVVGCTVAFLWKTFQPSSKDNSASTTIVSSPGVGYTITADMPVVKGSNAFQLAANLEEKGLPTSTTQELAGGIGFLFSAEDAKYRYAIYANPNLEIGSAEFEVFSQNTAFLAEGASFGLSEADALALTDWLSLNEGLKADTVIGGITYTLGTKDGHPILTMQSAAYANWAEIYHPTISTGEPILQFPEVVLPANPVTTAESDDRELTDEELAQYMTEDPTSNG